MPGKKANKKERKEAGAHEEARERELVRLVAMVVAEMERARTHRHEAEAAEAERQRAAERARYRLDVARECAALSGYPRSFGTRLHKRGLSVAEVAAVFRDACRLPVM